MKHIFIGPWLHWLILISLIAGGWLAGLDRLHVVNFNPFIIGLIVLTIAILVVVLKTSPPDQRITRDPIEDERQ